jgi:hypothetical protein
MCRSQFSHHIHHQASSDARTIPSMIISYASECSAIGLIQIATCNSVQQSFCIRNFQKQKAGRNHPSGLQFRIFLNINLLEILIAYIIGNIVVECVMVLIDCIILSV